MSNAIEIEAKALVRKEDYEKLASLFPNGKKISQTNYYIDSANRSLASEGIALRVREKEGSYEMTLKTPLSEGLLEKNCPIDPEEFADLQDKRVFPKNDIARFLTMLGFDVETLGTLTSLSTDRIDVSYEGGLLSLDKNEYSSQTDYEIEFEYNNLEGAQKLLKDLLQKEGIPCELSTSTKGGRAMRAIGK